jgi:chemotaxis protein methyltransferase CheR
LSATPGDILLTDGAFNRIRELVFEHTGISLSEAKRQLVFGRLIRRLRVLQLPGFGEYIELLERGEPEELEEFTNAVTTNLTSFFRENHHFDFLANEALPEAVKRNAQSRRLRIWSCACSTGEEPYSIAMVLREQEKLLGGMDARILATDLDSKVVATAESGVYDEERISAISKQRTAAYFLRGEGAFAGQVRVKPTLRELVRFRQLNLMHDWPVSGPFDVIFCRNVVIYFDKATQRTLFERLAALQRPGDILFLGHSESLYRVSEKYGLIGRTMYRRLDN